MSADEVVALIASVIVGLVTWGRWYAYIASVPRKHYPQRARRAAHLTPPICAGVLFVILRQFASHDVRDDIVYLVFYLVMGAAWVGLAAIFLPFFGLSARDDVVERGNTAAAAGISGALLGLTLCFAGGNIGDGPGWWVVVFCAFLSTTGFFLLWLCHESISGLCDAVTIDRDVASGIRLAGLLVALGLILGRSVAGNWESAGETWRDFLRTGWVALPLALGAAVLDRLLRPTPRPQKSSLG